MLSDNRELYKFVGTTRRPAGTLLSPGCTLSPGCARGFLIIQCLRHCVVAISLRPGFSHYTVPPALRGRNLPAPGVFSLYSASGTVRVQKNAGSGCFRRRVYQVMTEVRLVFLGTAVATGFAAGTVAAFATGATVATGTVSFYQKSPIRKALHYTEPF